MRKCTKSEWQRIKERFKLPWSVKTLTDFWARGCKPTGMGFKDLRKITDEDIDFQLRYS
ncbi:unnamed protein product [marine sediment metagenome]|uniref:Uncharacterized protein n=1 Tax=marine sediment metagenome TaxID=412755 RepID=X1HKP1_9ZZZZ